MQIIGLIFDIIGVLLLFIGTEILNNLVVKTVDHMKTGFGTYGMQTFDHEELKKFTVKKNISKFWTIMGLILLVLGFTLQLIVAIKQS